MAALAQPPDVLTLLRTVIAFAAFLFLPGYLALRRNALPAHERLLLSVLLSAVITAITGVALAFTVGMSVLTLSFSLSAVLAVEYALWKKR
jgi:uncharacterized membrane protein